LVSGSFPPLAAMRCHWEKVIAKRKSRADVHARQWMPRMKRGMTFNH
jgi:hypothetical protein